MSACTIPPNGWQCTRDASHAGPCAAIQSQANQPSDIEHAWRAGFAAAEEVLGAHGSEWLLDSIEKRWAEYAADFAIPDKEQGISELRLHVRHLLYAIDRGYFGENAQLSTSAFIEPLRNLIKSQSGKPA